MGCMKDMKQVEVRCTNGDASVDDHDVSALV